MKGICGYLNSECIARFDISLDDDEEVNKLDSSNKFPIIKDSKSYEKGCAIRIDGVKSASALVEFTDMSNKKIDIVVTQLKTKPLLRIFYKLPQPERLSVSEFYLEGHFEIEKVNLHNSKTILGAVIEQKLKEKNQITIDKRIFVEIVGPPAVKEVIHETEFGSIRRIRNKLDVEI